MNIQSTNNNNYISTLKKEELSSDLFLDKNKKTKARIEIRKENGYIRQYAIGENGEKILIQETKLPKGQDTDYSTGEMIDVLLENLLNKSPKQLDNQKSDELLKTGLTGQKAKEKLILVYQNSI